MSDRIYVRSGGYYIDNNDGTYTYYKYGPLNDGVIKTKEEIEEIIAKWSKTQKWILYYVIVLICLIVFAVLLAVSVSDKLLSWIFGVLTALSGAFLLAPLFVEFD